MITVRKIKLTIMGDEETRNRQYKWIKDEQYNQYKALNIGMSYLATHLFLKMSESGLEQKTEKNIKTIEKQISKIENNITKEESKKKVNEEKLNNLINELDTLNASLSKLKEELEEISNNRSNVDDTFKRMYVDDLYNALSKVPFQHSDMKSLVSRKVKLDFNTDMKDLMSGNRSVRNYKRNHPLLVRGRDLRFRYDGSNIKIKWIQGIEFKAILGKISKTIELRHILNKVIDGEYKVCDSSLEFNKNNHLILNLAIDFPYTNKIEFIEGRVVGVDLGIAVPAYVALNDIAYVKKSIGDIDDFLRVKTQMKKRRNLQINLTSVKGGKGRSKKLKALDRLSEKESNFVRTYNHFLSKSIVKFAIDNKAGQINLELLSENALSDKIIKNWSYYQLQQFIKYKAERYGIKVKYVDPYRTSQTCSVCGHYEEGQRSKQDIFTCKNEKCKMFEKEVNADYNAARNIAISTKYIDDIKESEYYYKKSF
ncbi:transposase [Gottschalkia purinilytica]|uniref:Transposase n=1 Tax=Gottschalkia purinilytica TaxID=1503 RepID=A0A0L0WAJ7_GOTPU|nr:RNA-guided endonuclease TnpB family protein [Gottschalkia purinilytica]KNF08516.1 transposase [Gottschalkia purinilytica]